MTTLVFAPLITRALAKIAQDAGPAMPPVAPMAAAPTTGSTAPALPDTKALVQAQLPKVAPVPAAPSAVVPDANSAFRDFLFSQRKFDPAELVKAKPFQQLYDNRMPGEQAMTPEQYLPKAQQDALDFQRTANPGRYAGFRMRQQQAGAYSADDLAKELPTLRQNLTPEQAGQFDEEQARGLLGEKQYDVIARRAAAKQPLPAEGLGAFKANDLSSWWGAAKDVASSVAGGAPTDDYADAQTLRELQGGQGQAQGQGDGQLHALNEAIKAGQKPEQFIAQQVANSAADKVAPFLAKPETDPSLMDQVKDGAKAFFSEPRNWIIPLGGLLMLFGGKTSKILGSLALAGGAADLYGRYQGIKSMGETPEGQEAYKLAVTAKDEKGQPAPFSNLKELITKYPQQARALQDTSTLFAMGLRSQFDKQVATKAVQTMTGMGVAPDVALTTLVQRKLIDQQTADDLRETMTASTADVAKRQAEQQAQAAQAVNK